MTLTKLLTYIFKLLHNRVEHLTSHVTLSKLYNSLSPQIFFFHLHLHMKFKVVAILLGLHQINVRMYMQSTVTSPKYS